MGIHAKAGGILGNEHMLLHALGRQIGDLLQNILHLPGAETATDQRDGAVGAAVVAAIGYADVGGVRRRGEHPVAAEHLLVELHIAGPLACHGFLNGTGQLVVLAHAKEQVDLRHFFPEGFLVALHKAARGHQQHAAAGFLILRQGQQRIDALLLCRVDEAAGIHNENLRLAFIRGEGMACIP